MNLDPAQVVDMVEVFFWGRRRGGDIIDNMEDCRVLV